MPTPHSLTEAAHETILSTMVDAARSQANSWSACVALCNGKENAKTAVFLSDYCVCSSGKVNM